jgi:MFS family permease
MWRGIAWFGRLRLSADLGSLGGNSAFGKLRGRSGFSTVDLMLPSVSTSERRLVLVVGAIVFVDTMFYAAIAPLLPALAHELSLSKLSAGIMTASYPLGTLVGAVPSGVLAARAGPKFTVCVGLAMLSGSTLAFGFLHNAPALDVARLIEGLGGACLWSGGLAWIIAEAPADRRGQLIGGALGAAIAGALFGPVIGTIATAAGRGPTFGAVVLVAILLAAEASRLHSAHVDSEQGVSDLLDALRSPAVVLGMWLVALPALAAGMISVLAPFRLHRLGAGAAAIGAAFLVGAAIEAAISPAIGRLSDRRGRLVPVRRGLTAVAVLLLCFTLPTSPLGLAAIVVGTDTALGAFWAPAMAMLSDAAEHRGLDQGLAAALTNLAWAGGQILGSGAGGGAAKAASDAVPLAIAAALCVGTLLLIAPARITSALRSKAQA